ncbi:hypothetical protein ALP8811_00561 [Aliiroseovarius pelagivivens]|uniref:Cytochrome c oxidase assembly protein n=1 Tax=Aliiroseovarius pelagivivens TaxID=1639690 RepID=A0A2R8AHR9_9RHOB|nr:hypothetical protein [Aliiroseovarius pelagivivens]SPF75568.1 hypothetical protein ALP8811_00561 [Aliiroseovarius pelagivivens]
MAIKAEHEMHKRRFSRNVGLGIVLVGFVALVYGLTVAKVSELYQPETATEASQ